MEQGTIALSVLQMAEEKEEEDDPLSLS